MEVHHHPDLHHEKKWKDYLFEFIMLFLAVFCGFIAENIRENSVERHREKEYIQSFISDLKNDTIEMRYTINQVASDNTGMDSLVHLAKENLSEPQNIRLFYYYLINYGIHSPSISWNNGTVQQLKNAGGLRLIRRSHAADSIMKYDVVKGQIDGQGKIVDNVTQATLDASDHLIDWTVFKGRNAGDLLSLNPTPAFVQDKARQQFFFNKIVKKQATGMFYRRDLEEQFQNAISLLSFLQKEYHLP